MDVEVTPDVNSLAEAAMARARNEYRELYADRLSKMERALRKAREALEPFALIAEHDIGDDEADEDRFAVLMSHNHAPRPTVGMFRHARAALSTLNELLDK